MNVLFKCGSPTCMAEVRIFVPAVLATVPSVLQAKGWLLQQQPGDDRRLPYCPRCLL